MSYDDDGVGGWTAMFRVEYTYRYDALGRTLEQIREVKSGTGAPLAKTRQISTYPSGPGGYTEREYFTFESGAWKGVDKYSNCVWHDFDRGQFLSAEYYLMNGANYALANVYTYTYPNPTDYTLLSQGPVGATLVNNFLLTHEVRGDTTRELTQTWIGSWVNDTRWTDMVNGQGHSVRYSEEKFENGRWTTQKLDENFFTYNAQNVLVQLIEELHFGTPLALGLKWRWQYSDFIALTAARPMIAAEVRTYPSPASDWVTLHLAGGAVNIRAVDAAGQSYPLILKEGKADVSTLKPGLYHICAVGRHGKVYKGRFIKE